MNEKLFRPQFDTLKLSDKLWLMQTLATRYNLTFKELYAFSRWGQSCTTGLFEKGGREFVFVPGDTVILGWESFAQGMDKANQEELADIFTEIEYEGTPIPYCSISLVIDRSCVKKETDCSLEKVAIPSK